MSKRKRGSTTAISDKNGVIASLEYDSANRLLRLTDMAKSVAVFGYDEMGNLISQKIPDEPVKTFEYDSRGRISAVGKDSARTEFTYDSAGLLRQSKSIDTDRVVLGRYNRFGKLDSVLSVDSTMRFIYDAGGRETARIYSDGERFEREYDAAGRVKIERLPKGRTVKYVYNADGKIVRQSDNQGSEIRADYDALGLLSKLSGPKGWTRAVRDRAGRITGLENSAGQRREFRYNANGALVEFTNAKGETYKYFYTERGKLKGATNSKGTRIEYKLDAAGNAVAVKRFKFNDRANFSFSDIGFETKAAQSLDIYNCGELGFLDEFGKVQPMTGMALPPDAIPVCSDPFYGLETINSVGGDFGGGIGWGFSEDKDCRESLGCISTGTGCLLAVVGYRALTLALIAACPETVGVGCIAALLTYFGGSIASAAVCSQAIIECSKPKCK